MNAINLKILLINLDEDLDRLEHMTNQFISLGLEFERISAFHGLQGILSQDILLEKYNKDISDIVNSFGRSLTPGEIGCAISHHLCYQKIVDEGVDIAVIFEDDVLLSSDFNEALKYIVESEKKWDLVQLSYPFYGSFKMVYDTFIFKIIAELNQLRRKINIKNLIRLLFSPLFNLILNTRSFFFIKYKKGLYKNFYRNHAGMGCYIINNKTAKLLLDLTDEITYSADNLLVKVLSGNKNLNNMSYYPPVARQDLSLFESSIIRISKIDHGSLND